ncbi:MAG: TRAM domain-containing protein [Proteobacteria bacterium]|nr:TRAM domain-containing protein [Pseudomonadota bacterium]
MGSLILWIVLILSSSLGGYLAVSELTSSKTFALWGLLSGAVLAILAILFVENAKKASLRKICGGVLGLLVGLLFGQLISAAVPLFVKTGGVAISGVIYSILGYVGLKIGLRKGEEFNLQSLTMSKGTGVEQFKILDTSVIIDGRVADICETGFIEGVFIIPQFVLHELQHIADSPDSVKRTRGKRGLEILHRMQKSVDIEVRISDQDFPRIKEVDTKLVELAKRIDGKIITNDANLNKVAELQGVSVLNINALANALKPVVLPGEELGVYVLKEGKEPGQGVAYLDDGTMVVIENGRKFMGRSLDVVVTSVLQTTAGRMIFARVKEEGASNHGETFQHRQELQRG